MAKIIRGIISVLFGSWPQANGTVNPIEWEVLKQDGNKALLIIKAMKPLIMRCFDSKSNVWADSEIRRWLNGEFLDAAFTDDEKAAIYETELPDVGTTDKVFLLSHEEAKKLFKDNKARRVKFGRAYRWWWLRSPGDAQRSAEGVNKDGSLPDIRNVSRGDRVVRPALWVNLDSDIFKS